MQYKVEIENMRLVEVIPQPQMHRDSIKWYNEQYKHRKSYPILASDLSYWQPQDGKIVGEGEFEVTLGCYKNHEYRGPGEPCLCGHDLCMRISCIEYAFPKQTQHAIPIQPKEQGEELTDRLVQAVIGTSKQHDIIQGHMNDYFKRFPSYENRLTNLEWYHLFLDFLDKIELPTTPVASDEDVTWRKVVAEILVWAWTNQPDTNSVGLINKLKQSHTLKPKE